MGREWYVQALLDSFLSVLMLGALMLCFSLWINRLQLGSIFQALRVRSVGFNFLVCAFDIIFFLVPVAVIVDFGVGAGAAFGMKLFLPGPMTWWGVGLCGLVAIFVGDFVAYWRHRLEHLGWFWKAHVMHHSDRHMNWTTIYRFHPINRITTTVVDGAVIALVGFPWWAVALNAMVRHYYGAFVHINQPWTLGWLGRIFVSPAMHRWHHVLEGEGVGKNFASVFSIFDRAFGTYYCPGACDVELGVPGVGDGELVRQYLLPFRIGDNLG